MSSLRLFHKEDVVGKTVIDSTGQTSGMVKDVMFSLNSVVILVVEKKDGTEMQLPLSKVVGLSEFVVTRSESPSQPTSAGGTSFASTSGHQCKFCGHEMLPASLYCPSCGKAQR
jgi:sporulation protein YlmC with PRC-barrel domain